MSIRVLRLRFLDLPLLCFYRSNSHESGIEFADEDSAGGGEEDDFEEPMLAALGSAKALYPFEGLNNFFVCCCLHCF